MYCNINRKATIINYDVIIIGAGPGGIFSAYELSSLRPDLKIAVFEAGHPLKKRNCPIDGEKIKSCMGCKSCSIMSGFGGAGAFSDGKYNITNDFGGTLYEYIGKKHALDLMKYVDEINMRFGGAGKVDMSYKYKAVKGEDGRIGFMCYLPQRCATAFKKTGK